MNHPKKKCQLTAENFQLDLLNGLAVFPSICRGKRHCLRGTVHKAPPLMEENATATWTSELWPGGGEVMIAAAGPNTNFSYELLLVIWLLLLIFLINSVKWFGAIIDNEPRNKHCIVMEVQMEHR